jgi:hypothetical protein
MQKTEGTEAAEQRPAWMGMECGGIGLNEEVNEEREALVPTVLRRGAAALANRGGGRGRVQEAEPVGIRDFHGAPPRSPDSDIQHQVRRGFQRLRGGATVMVGERARLPASGDGQKDSHSVYGVLACTWLKKN